MRLSHVLSMNTGHAGCVMPHMYHTDDVARAFLAQPVPFRPGTHFAYNTGATCLLSALVQRVSGETLFDYVNRKLFVPLGICGAYWNNAERVSMRAVSAASLKRRYYKIRSALP